VIGKVQSFLESGQELLINVVEDAWHATIPVKVMILHVGIRISGNLSNNTPLINEIFAFLQYFLRVTTCDNRKATIKSAREL
jgi:hypothetical protein